MVCPQTTTVCGQTMGTTAFVSLKQPSDLCKKQENMKLGKQDQARDLYLNHGKSQTEIAQRLGVERKTVYRWIKDGRWEEMKKAKRQVPAAMQQRIYAHIESVHDKIARYSAPQPADVSMLVKLMAMAKQYDQLHIGMYMQAYDELLGMAGKQSNELAHAIAELTDAIVISKIPGDAIITLEQEPVEEPQPEKESRPQRERVKELSTQKESRPKEQKTKLLTGNKSKDKNASTSKRKREILAQYLENQRLKI